MTMKVKKIYFDMDGVLADFGRGVRELCGLEPISQGAKNNDSAEEDRMWNAIKDSGHFYDKLELMPGAKELFDAIYKRYGDKCEILTGIPKPKRGIDSAGDDKKAWVKRLLSKDIKVNIVYREEKARFCTGKDCILIDDFDKNIREWEAMGGTGVLSICANETCTELEKLGIIGKSNIVLIGMPASGKSTVGVILAKILGKSFLDTDLVIQQRESALLCEIIEKSGVDGFLNAEEKAVLSISPYNTVIATGGSVVYSDKAMRHLSEIATVIYLKVSKEEISHRLRNIRERGVVLKDGESFDDMYDHRSVLYEKYADIVIEEDGSDIEETIVKIQNSTV